MNELIKNKIYNILKNENIDLNVINKVMPQIEDLFKVDDNFELPKSIKIITPLYNGVVFLGQQGGKYFYKNPEGAIVIYPNSKKIISQKLKKLSVE